MHHVDCEIAAKGAQSRFKKAGRGQFAANK